MDTYTDMSSEIPEKFYLVNRETYSKGKPNKPFGVVYTKNLTDLPLVKISYKDIKPYDFIVDYEEGKLGRVGNITPNFITIRIFAKSKYIGSKFTDDGSKYEEEKKFYKWIAPYRFYKKKIKKTGTRKFIKIDIDDFEPILKNNWYHVSRFVDKNYSIYYK